MLRDGKPKPQRLNYLLEVIQPVRDGRRIRIRESPVTTTVLALGVLKKEGRFLVRKPKQAFFERLSWTITEGRIWTGASYGRGSCDLSKGVERMKSSGRVGRITSSSLAMTRGGVGPRLELVQLRVSFLKCEVDSKTSRLHCREKNAKS